MNKKNKFLDNDLQDFLFSEEISKVASTINTDTTASDKASAKTASSPTVPKSKPQPGSTSKSQINAAASSSVAKAKIPAEKQVKSSAKPKSNAKSEAKQISNSASAKPSTQPKSAASQAPKQTPAAKPTSSQAPKQTPVAKPASSQAPKQTVAAKPTSSQAPKQTVAAKPASSQAPKQTVAAKPASSQTQASVKQVRTKLPASQQIAPKATPVNSNNSVTKNNVSPSTKTTNQVNKGVTITDTRPASVNHGVTFKSIDSSQQQAKVKKHKPSNPATQPTQSANIAAPAAQAAQSANKATPVAQTATSANKATHATGRVAHRIPTTTHEHADARAAGKSDALAQVEKLKAAKQLATNSALSKATLNAVPGLHSTAGTENSASEFSPEDMQEMARRIAEMRYEQEHPGYSRVDKNKPTNKQGKHAATKNSTKNSHIKSAADTPVQPADTTAGTRKKSRKSRSASPEKKGILQSRAFVKPDGSRAFLGKLLLPKEKPVTIGAKFLLGLRYFALVCASCVILGIGYSSFAIITAPSIDPANIYDAISDGSTLYDQNGTEICTVDSGQDREIVQYDDLPENLVNAVVALEDKTFWKHHGFNWIRMCGAVFDSITGGGGISGTSTITQQLARNVYLADIKSERSLKRKIIEMYYAAKIEHTLSKEEIFAAYINSIYFGFGNYGAEAASNTYFSKSVKALDLTECAVLAALPQSPDTYAPLKSTDGNSVGDEDSSIIQINGVNYICNDISKDRRDTCIQLMYDQGYITKDQYNSAYDKPMKDILNPTITEEDDGLGLYFKDYVIDTVITDLQDKYDLSYENAATMVYNGGLKIHTTMDAEAQKSVLDAFEEESNFPTLASLNTNEDGDVVTDDGSISLYSYDNLFSSSGNFILKPGEFTINKDGSLKITAHKRLYFYVNETDDGTTYSIEFKPCYETKDGKTYIHSGGVINIPDADKTMDENDDITISADYVKNNPDLLHESEKNPGSYVISSKAFTLEPAVIQPQAAMVITEVGTGELKAMVGGRGITGSNLYNRATSTRQPGSSIKPLSIYSAALQKSYELEAKGKKFTYKDYGIDTQGTQYYGDYLTAASTIIDEKTTIENRTWPTNDSGTYSGAMTMRRAMQQSCNVAAVKLYLQITGEYSAEMVQKYGITTLETSGDNSDINPAALAMGGLSQGVSPLEMSEAFTVFPNGGERNSVICYTTVVDRHNDTILESNSETTEVIDEGVAFIMTDMLKDVVSGGTGTNAAISGVEVGGKTGTTSNNYDIWFDGFTPTYSASVWIGSDVNIELNANSSTAASLWGRVMSNISAAKSGSYPEQPSDVVQTNGEYFTTGTDSGIVSTDSANTTDESVEEEIPTVEPSPGAVDIDPEEDTGDTTPQQEDPAPTEDTDKEEDTSQTETPDPTPTPDPTTPTEQDQNTGQTG